MEKSVKAAVATRTQEGCRETYVQYEKMLDLPAASPMPGQLQAVTASPRILTAAVGADRVSLSAGIDFRVSYEGRADGGLYTMTEVVLIERSIDWAGAQEGDLCRVHLDVEEVAYEPVRDEMGDIRRIRVKAYLRILCELEKVRETQLLTPGDEEDLQIKWQEISQLRQAGGMEKTFVVPGKLSLSRGLPEVNRVVSASGVLRELNWTLGAGEWRLSGVLGATVVYEGTVGGGTEVFVVEESFPFREDFSFPGLLPEDVCLPEVTVERLRAEVLHDGEERAAMLECFADVRVRMQTFRPETTPVLADVFSTRSQLTLTQETVAVTAFQEARRESIHLRETVTLAPEPMLEGLWVTDSRILPRWEDGAFKGGTVCLWVEMLSREDGLPRISGRRLRFDVPVEGDVSGLCRLTLRDVDVRPVGRGEMQVKAEIAGLFCREETISLSLPVSMKTEGPWADSANLIFYRPFPGEEVFQAAKALHVPVDTVLSAAGMDADGPIGRELIVLRGKA